MTGEPLRILVVDDEAEMRAALTAQLGAAFPGAAVDSADGAAPALSYLRAHRVDVVISDQGMPGMDGVTFLTSVGRDQPDVARILLTDMGTWPLAARALNEARVTGVLLTPTSARALVDMIERVVDARHRARAATVAFARALSTVPLTDGDPA